MDANDGYCEECRKEGKLTPAEKYKKITLKLCTYHYWLLRAKLLGYSLDEYAEKSRKFMFVTSLPSNL